MRQIVLDTETTGLEIANGHRIIEIGCIEMLDRRPTGKQFHYYINPERPVEEGALAVHGIDNIFLQDKPLFKDIVDEFVEFVADSELIIHNAPFDIGFLNAEFSISGKPLKKLTAYCRVLDTLALARQLHPGQRNSLDALCKRYKIDNSHRNLHGGLLDAMILARVYLAMTGGQANLFEEASAQNILADNFIPLSKKSEQPLLVINADEAEHHAHLEYIEKIKKQSQGKCVWED